MTGGNVVREINVVGAVIVDDGRVLCAQRGTGGTLAGMWEFPGGKVEEHEPPEEALAREIHEELDCIISVGGTITTTTHEYDFGIVTLTTYYCSLVDGTPHAREHSSIKWITPRELASLEWAPADIPAVELISTELA